MFKSLIKSLYAVSLVLLVLLNGCRTGPIVPTAPGTTDSISRSSFQPTTDIPIPNGARFDSDASLVLSSKDYWTGRLVLDADQSISQIFAFYQKQMPQLKWEPVASVLSTTSVLTFIRQNRTATVQITPKSWRGSEISITVAIRDPAPTNGFGAKGMIEPNLAPAPNNKRRELNQTKPAVSPVQQSNASQRETAIDGPKFQQQIPRVY